MRKSRPDESQSLEMSARFHSTIATFWKYYLSFKMNAIDDAFVSGTLFLFHHSSGLLQNSASAWNSSPPPSIGCLHISASAEQKSAVHVGLVVSAQGCIFFLYPSSLLVQRCLFRVSKTPLSTRFACSWVPLYSRQSYIPGWIHLGPSDVFTPKRIHFGSCAARFARVLGAIAPRPRLHDVNTCSYLLVLVFGGYRSSALLPPLGSVFSTNCVFSAFKKFFFPSYSL